MYSKDHLRWTFVGAIGIILVVDVFFGYLVVSSYTGIEGNLVSQSEYNMEVSIPFYHLTNESATPGPQFNGVVRITGETPVDHEIIAFEPIQIAVIGNLTSNLSRGNASTITFVIAGALAGLPRGSTVTPATIQSVTSGYNGGFQTMPVSAFYATSGTFSIYMVDAVYGEVAEAQIPVEQPYLTQETAINHVQLILAAAIYVFGVFESLNIVKGLWPRAFPSRSDLWTDP